MQLEGGKNSNKTERKKKTESFLDLFRSGPELRRPAIGMLYIRYVQVKAYNSWNANSLRNA